MNCGICYAICEKRINARGVGYLMPKSQSVLPDVKLKNCEIIQKGKVKYCFECDNFSLQKFKTFG